MKQIFIDVNSYLFEKEHVDLNHIYIDGTKIEANSNHYTWVWKKSYLRNCNKVFEKLSVLIDSMNTSVLNYLGIKREKQNEYAIDSVTELLENYKTATTLDTTKFVSGTGPPKKYRTASISGNVRLSGTFKSICKAYRNMWGRKEIAILRQTMMPLL